MSTEYKYYVDGVEKTNVGFGTEPSGRTIELTGDGRLEVPVASTLGVDIGITLGSTAIGVTMSPITNGNNLVFDGNANHVHLGFFAQATVFKGTTTVIEFEAVVNSGVLIISSFLDGTVNIPISPYTVVDGHNFIELPYTYDGGGNRINIYPEGGTIADVDITLPTAKEVLSVEGTILVWDADQGRHVQIAGDSGLGSEELAANGDFSDGWNRWGATGADLTVVSGGLELNTLVNNYHVYLLSDTEIPAVGRILWHAEFEPGNLVNFSLGLNNIANSKTANTDSSPIHEIVTPAANGRIRAYGYQNPAVENVMVWNSISAKQVLDLSTVHTFKNQKIGHFVLLSAGQYFTEADIALIDAHPEILTAWALGEQSILSLVKHVDDAYYSCTEEGSSVVRTDGYALGAEENTNAEFDSDINGWIISSVPTKVWSADRDGSLHITADDNSQPIIKQSYALNGLYVQSFDVDLVVGEHIDLFTIADGVSSSIAPNNKLPLERRIYSVLSYNDNYVQAYLYFYNYSDNGLEFYL